MKVVLYSRKGCHLCENAEEMLLFHHPAAVTVDIDTAIELKQLFSLRVPVLVIDGQVALEGNFQEREIVRCLTTLAE
jgi:glutaredoxin